MSEVRPNDEPPDAEAEPAEPVPFASPSKGVLDAWRDGARAGLLLDLCYGAVAWREVRRRWLGGGDGDGGGDADADADGGKSNGDYGWRPSKSEPLLYVNCGGHEGLRSMLRRYGRLALLGEGETAEALLAEAEGACGVKLPPEEEDVWQAQLV